MGNGAIYSVPPFQRDYSWQQEQWDDLWQDIVGILDPNGEPAHYMGYLVLQSDGNEHYAIIDGQQRITTLSLLVLAILHHLQALAEDGKDSVDNSTRYSEIRKTFVGFLDTVSMATHSKLTLNRNNDNYYQSYIIPLRKLPVRGIKASERLLKSAYEWMVAKVHGHFGVQMSGSKLAQLLEIFSSKLFFTVITVSDELNAYKVFETLNSRGVQLSSTDLLKNYLFSVVSHDSGTADDLEIIEKKWEIIVGKIGNDKLPDYLRVYWNSRNSLTRHAGLFKDIKTQVKTNNQAFDLLFSLEEEADLFAALRNPEDELWKTNPQRQKHVRELRIFGVIQPFSLLLAAHRRCDEETFTRVLRATVMISFRYNVIGSYNTNEQEHAYNNTALKIDRRELITAAEIIRDLSAVYVTDDKFINAFWDKELKTTDSRNAKRVRYILFELEKHLSGADYDIDSDRYTIEHILPESPGHAWDDFDVDEQDNYIYRLGNLTLLEKGHNRALGNSGYAQKRLTYATATFQMTRKVAEENAEWRPERISERQRWMAKQAKAIWRLDL
jgi:hypothetical protein